MTIIALSILALAALTLIAEGLRRWRTEGPTLVGALFVGGGVVLMVVCVGYQLTDRARFVASLRPSIEQESGSDTRVSPEPARPPRNHHTRRTGLLYSHQIS